MTRVVVIGNYPPDRQQSMERFARMLQNGFEAAGTPSEIWRPITFFARPGWNTTAGLKKWLGYLDKWLIYPLILRSRVRRLRRNNELAQARFHIADHSNAFYLRHLPADQTAITCHDVLAIRGALGDADTYCPASRMGKRLQAWILRNLSRARTLAAVSQTTLDQLERLASEIPAASTAARRDWRVILNGFNADFSPMPPDESAPLLEEAGIEPDTPFLLHVGSSLPRKNRGMLLEMAAEAGDHWAGNIVFAGAPVDAQLQKAIGRHGLGGRVRAIHRPAHRLLVALYSRCFAFVFPSFSEGFGWPAIEAQACGAPVIASDAQPMPEVSGGAALHAPPDDARAFGLALIEITDLNRRASLINAGHENCLRFQIDKIMDQYRNLHGLDA